MLKIQIVATICLLLLASACAQTSASAPGLDSSAAQKVLTADEVLAHARTAMAEVESYRFTGEWVLNSGPVNQRWVRSGEWVAPDRFRLKFQGIDQIAGQGQELLVIGDSGYFRRAGREQWVELEVSPATRSDASGVVIPELSGVRFLGGSEPDQRGLYHVIATTGNSLTDAPDPTRVADIVTTYSIAIRAADYLVDEVVVETTSSISPSRAAGVSDVVERPVDAGLVQRIVTRYHDFDTPVTIEAPAESKKADQQGGRVSQAPDSPG